MKHYDPNHEKVKEWKQKLKERLEKKRLAKLKKGSQNEQSQNKAVV